MIVRDVGEPGRTPDTSTGLPAAGQRSLNRRDFISLGAGAFVLLSVPGVVRGRRSVLVRRTVPLMGTIAEFAIASRDSRFAHAAIDAAISELRTVENRLTRFRAESDVGRANLAPAGVGVPIDAETATALRESIRWANLTEGRFDPCLARAILLWDVGSREDPPSASAIRQFAGRRLHRYLELDGPGANGGGAAIRLHHPDAGIDLGGIGKGFGVDRAIDALRQRDVKDALVNVGGDLYALGRSDDDAWRIGVRSPTNPSRLATTLEVSDQAVATSGDYVQYFEHGGRRYHHLLDPETGEPRRSDRRSVTVAASTCTAADAAATAIFGVDAAHARQLLADWEPGARVAHAT
jgi:thiamine biosynthesis lipoprotein